VSMSAGSGPGSPGLIFAPGVPPYTTPGGLSLAVGRLGLPLDPGDYPTASDVFDELRAEPYITSVGNRGIELNNSEFGTLADALYHECGWEPFQIRSRLKHYEGWDDRTPSSNRTLVSERASIAAREYRGRPNLSV